jgi:hypothetical protein
MLWPSLGSKVMNSDAAGRPPFHASGYGWISLIAGSVGQYGTLGMPQNRGPRVAYLRAQMSETLGLAGS